jgi:hypothetical protein
MKKLGFIACLVGVVGMFGASQVGRASGKLAPTVLKGIEEGVAPKARKLLSWATEGVSKVPAAVRSALGTSDTMYEARRGGDEDGLKGLAKLDKLCAKSESY